MKKQITKFDINAAFRALDEIDIPVVHGIKPNRINLSESMKRVDKLELLMEDYYDVNDQEELADAKEEREDEIAKAKLARIEKIVDLDADSPDDIQPSYVGKTIIQCPQCMTLFYKDAEDLVADETDPDTVNVGEACQHCGNESGYTIVGKVAEADESEMGDFNEEELPVENSEEDNELNLDFDEPTEEVDNNEADEAELEPAAEEEDEKKEESFVRPVGEALNEGADEDLNKKLAEHNAYIEYLQNEIKKSEEALDKATNEFVKKSLEKAIEALKADLDEAIPAEVKDAEPVGDAELPEADIAEDDLGKVDEEDEKKEESLNLNKEFHHINKKNASEYDSENLTLNEGWPASHYYKIKGVDDIERKKPVRKDFKSEVEYERAVDNYDTNKDRTRGRYLDVLDGLNKEGWALVKNEDIDIILDNFEEFCEFVSHDKHVPVKGQGLGKTEDDLLVANAKVPGCTLIYIRGAQLIGWTDDMPAPKSATIKSYFSEEEAKYQKKVAAERAKLNKTGEANECLASANESLDDEMVAPGDRKVVESVNLNKEFHDINKKNASENDSKNLTLNEENAAEFDKMLDSQEFQTPISDEEIRGYFADDTTNECLKEDVDANRVYNSGDIVEDTVYSADGEAYKIPDGYIGVVSYNAGLMYAQPNSGAEVAVIKETDLDEFKKYDKLADDIWNELYNRYEKAGKDSAGSLASDREDDEIKEFNLTDVLGYDLSHANFTGAEIYFDVLNSPVEVYGEDANIWVDATNESLKEDADAEIEAEVEVEETPVEEVAFDQNEVKDIANEVAEEIKGDELSEEEAEAVEEKVDEKVEEKIEAETEEVEDEEAEDFDDVEDIDDDSINECISKYLTAVYENVQDFTMTGCNLANNELLIEGNINFKSGNKNATSFKFGAQNAKHITGINESIAKDGKFELTYNITNKCLFAEGLKYSYKVNDILIEGVTNRK